MKIIAYTEQDGSVNTITMNEQSLIAARANGNEALAIQMHINRQVHATTPWLPDESASAFNARVNAILEAHPRIAMDHAELPSERWRNSWVISGNAVEIDIAKARLQRKAELIAEREKVLASIRSQATIADEDGDQGKATQLKTTARSLRAIESTLDAELAAINDLSQLATYKPSAFGG